jgi:hypothetical protein
MHGFEVATRVRGAAVVSILVSLVAVGSARAAVVCVPNVAVDGSCTSSATSIQSAIDAASAGDTEGVGRGRREFRRAGPIPLAGVPGRSLRQPTTRVSSADRGHLPLGGSETRSVPCATQASLPSFVTSTRTTAERRPRASTVDTAVSVPPRTARR